jgi:hypothetical protein
MSRRALRLAPLVALLLLLQWGTAFAHCLGGLGGNGLTVEICTADGLRTLHLDNQEQENGPAAAYDSCPVCPGTAALEAIDPPSAAAPIAYVRTPPSLIAGLPTAPARAPPQQPRAPPTA